MWCPPSAGSRLPDRTNRTEAEQVTQYLGGPPHNARGRPRLSVAEVPLGYTAGRDCDALSQVLARYPYSDG